MKDFEEYVIKVDGQYWCGESDEPFGHVGALSGGWVNMCPNGNMLYDLKFSPNLSNARKTLDPPSAMKNIFLRLKQFNKIEIERINNAKEGC